MAASVVIFDFDKTIVNVDTDNWVIDELGFTNLFVDHLISMPWNSLMDRMMKEIHGNGKNIDDIVEVLKRTPINNTIVPAIKASYASGCELRIVSDANMFFVETILKHLGIRDYFSEIKSNPSYVDEHGRLRISPFQDFTQSCHGCSICPPNMCKGKIMGIIKSKVGERKIIYVSGGSGDYCPSLKLTKSDYFVLRKNSPIWDIKPQVFEWTDGKELERVVLQIGTSLEEFNGKSALMFSKL